MVGRLNVGKRKYAEVNDEMRVLIVKAEEIRRRLTARIEEDTAAFNAVMAALQAPESDGRRAGGAECGHSDGDDPRG
jgi:formiminotetrahydrofolate cyclodeaminase